MNARLRYTRQELLQNHDYAALHEAAGYALHGGFLADGTYASPRTLHRWPAVKAWGHALEARGWPLIDASGDLLMRGSYPNEAQETLLLKAGLGQTLWNSLTVTGVIEARGQALCNLPAPDLQRLIIEPIADTGLGHLGQGLFYAHGADEGGDPADMSRGAHDAMWFAVRDMVFGKNAYPLPEVPGSIARPVEGREMPQLPEGIEQLIKFMMNVLMIEIRAESFFSFCCRLFRDPQLFTDRRDAAELAAVMVERIRADEAIHVAYLQLVTSELRSLTLRTLDGGQVSGASIIDLVWSRMVDWHGREERELAAARTRIAVESQVIDAKGEVAGRAILAAFDQLAA